MADIQEIRTIGQEIRGVNHLICPCKGAKCCAINLDKIGYSMARDAMSVHIDLHHRAWK